MPCRGKPREPVSRCPPDCQVRFIRRNAPGGSFLFHKQESAPELQGLFGHHTPLAQTDDGLHLLLLVRRDFQLQPLAGLQVEETETRLRVALSAVVPADDTLVPVFHAPSLAGVLRGFPCHGAHDHNRQ